MYVTVCNPKFLTTEVWMYMRFPSSQPLVPHSLKWDLQGFRVRLETSNATVDDLELFRVEIEIDNLVKITPGILLMGFILQFLAHLRLKL